MARQQLIVETKTPKSCVVHTDYTVSYTPSSGGGWAKKGDNINGEWSNDQSGRSVSLSSDGNVVAIGAPHHNGGGGGSGQDAGHVRVYAWNGTIWEKRGGDIEGEGFSYSGRSVSLSSDGTIVAIGANSATSTNKGHVRVYQYDATKTTADTNQYEGNSNFGPVGWNRLGADIDGELHWDQSGYSVSLSSDGSIVAIGSKENSGSFTYAGHVRVYQYDVTKTTVVTDQSSPDFGPKRWRRLGADIDGETTNDNSGRSVSLSSDGSTVAIGAYFNDGTGLSNSGHVRVYKYDATKTTAENDQTSSDFGPVGWNRLGADIDGAAANDYSGYSVSLSSDGTIVAIGAPGTDLWAGHVRVYKYDVTKTTAETDQSSPDFGPVKWRRLGADIDGESGGDNSGMSVSLSSDGSIVAIGAYGNDAAGTGSGHVRAYEYKTITEDEYDEGNTANTTGAVGVPIIMDGGVSWGENTKFWVQQGDDIDGGATIDWSGYSVSLNDNGRTVAIGAPYADSNGLNNNGNVRVYRIGSSISPQVGDWAVAEHKETDTGADLSTYTYRVTHVTDADTLVLKFVSSSELGGLSNSVYSYSYVIENPSIYQQLDSGLRFSPDGTKVFFLDYYTSGVSSYSHIRRRTLSTPWDITSSSSDGSQLISTAPRVKDITFSPDGTKLYATDDTDDRVKEFTLSSPWHIQDLDVNTMNTGTLDTQGYNPWGLAFSPDGTKLYVCDHHATKIYWYTLTTPWDIDTAVLASASLSVSSQDTYPRSIDFSSDGRDLYVLGGQNDTIYQYTLTTPWDLSTASYSGYSLYVGSQDLGPVGMVIPPGRNELYMAGQSNGAIYRYTLPEEYPDLSPCDLCDGTGPPGDCPIAPHVIKRDLGGMFMMLLD